MTINEYQKLAMRTCSPYGFCISNVGLGLAGEAGECADLIKKTLHQGHSFDKEKLINELGDVCWYVALACSVMDIDMEEVLELNIEKLAARYPDKFEAERSINREEVI